MSPVRLSAGDSPGADHSVLTNILRNSPKVTQWTERSPFLHNRVTQIVDAADVRDRTSPRKPPANSRLGAVSGVGIGAPAKNAVQTPRKQAGIIFLNQAGDQCLVPPLFGEVVARRTRSVRPLVEHPSGKAQAKVPCADCEDDTPAGSRASIRVYAIAAYNLICVKRRLPQALNVATMILDAKLRVGSSKGGGESRQACHFVRRGLDRVRRSTGPNLQAIQGARPMKNGAFFSVSQRQCDCLRLCSSNVAKGFASSARGARRVRSVEKRPQHKAEPAVVESDEILQEYDFSNARPNKFAERYAVGSAVVVLEPDVALMFPNAAEVNEALRALAGIIHKHKTRRPGPRRSA